MKILRIFLGLVFLSAGIFRIFNLNMALVEMNNLHLSTMLTWPIIGLEIIGGTLLIINKQIKKTLIVLLAFLSLALAWGLFVNGQDIIGQAKELFIYTLNSTDFFLHVTFLVIILSLLLFHKKQP